MDHLPAEPFWLDGKLVDPSANEIDGQRIDSKAMSVLVWLAQAAPGVATHAQLLEAVWPKVVVGDNVLHQAIAHLRKALGDEARSPRFIENVPRRGYRLRVEVVRVPLAASGSMEHRDPDPLEHPAGWRFRRVTAVVVAAVLLGALWWTAVYERPPAAPQANAVPERSIAVLPFVNIGSDPAYEYFSDGLSEELIHTLARNPELKVTSRTSAFYFKGRSADLPTIARQLGVAYVLEGSVRMSGDEVRVAVLLVDPATDAQIWAATFDRKMGDILALQNEIASHVLNKLKVTLGPMATPREVHPQAYLRYLEARHLQSLDNEALLPRAAALLDEALTIDGSFVRAWTERARASFGLGDHEAAARYRMRAAELDPDDPVVNGFLGWKAFYQSAKHQDLAKAAAYYSRALAAEPTNVDVPRPMTLLLIRLGRLSEAVAVSHWLLSQDPLCVICRNNLGQAHLAARRFADADRAWAESLTLAPDSGTARAYLAWSQLLQGRPQESLATLEGRSNSHPAFEWIRALALHHVGETEAAAQMLDALQSTWGSVYPYLFATSHAMTGNRDAAFDWLERSADSLPIDVAYPHLSEGLKALHGDPRWPAALERLGLSPQQLQRIEITIALPGLEP
jgi:adenylate cyclase